MITVFTNNNDFSKQLYSTASQPYCIITHNTYIPNVCVICSDFGDSVIFL